MLIMTFICILWGKSRCEKYNNSVSFSCLQKMAPNLEHVSTFVFLDLETTDLIYNKRIPEITEISMLAVSRDALMMEKPEIPRVMPKILLQFLPVGYIDPKASQITGK